MNFTPRRQQWIEDAGYTVTRMHMCNVRGWFGISLIIVCEKGTQLSQEITFDRVPWKAVPLPEDKAETSRCGSGYALRYNAICCGESPVR